MRVDDVSAVVEFDGGAGERDEVGGDEDAFGSVDVGLVSGSTPSITLATSLANSSRMRVSPPVLANARRPLASRCSVESIRMRGTGCPSRRRRRGHGPMRV